MFETIKSNIQDAIGGFVKDVVLRLVIGVLFLCAGTFLIAALAVYLHATFGSLYANLMLAGLFLLLALIGLGVIASQRRDTIAEPSAPPRALPARAESGLGKITSLYSQISPADRDLLVTAAKTAGPLVLANAVRIVPKRLPLLAGVAAAAFLVTKMMKRPGPTANRQ